MTIAPDITPVALMHKGTGAELFRRFVNYFRPLVALTFINHKLLCTALCSLALGACAPLSHPDPLRATVELLRVLDSRSIGP